MSGWRSRQFSFLNCPLWERFLDYKVNPFAYGNLELVERFSSHCYEELKLTTKPFTCPTLRCLLIQIKNISLCSSGMRRKQNFEFLCLRVARQSWLFLLASSFAFLALFYFSLCWALVGFILVGNVFGKAFRILVEQDVRGHFRSMLHGFLPFLSGLLDRIMPILVWFERSPHPAQVSRQSYPWPLKLVTSQAVEGTWIRRGGYGRLRGKWVKVMSCVNWSSVTRAFHQHITNVSALYTQRTQEKLTQTYMHFPYHQSSWTCHATLPCELELVQYWKD